jgi:hypothetical protein
MFVFCQSVYLWFSDGEAGDWHHVDVQSSSLCCGALCHFLPENDLATYSSLLFDVLEWFDDSKSKDGEFIIIIVATAFPATARTTAWLLPISPAVGLTLPSTWMATLF